MSATFTKLSSAICESSLWSEDSDTRVLWITLLAMADQFGRVQAAVPGLARKANIPIEKARQGLNRFLAPDPDSRTPDNEGRRIEAIEGGWRLLNYEFYRELKYVEDRKEQNRQAQQRRRERLRHQIVSNSQHKSAESAHAEAEAEAEIIHKKESKVQIPERQQKFMDQLGSLYHRRQSTAWDEKELKVLREIMKRPEADDELVQITTHYRLIGATPEKKYLKQNLPTLLNNWTGQLDNARGARPIRRDAAI
jgi:hypothetical protein